MNSSQWHIIQKDSELQAALRGPPSAQALGVQRKIREQSTHPVDALKAAIATNASGLDVVRICLQAYFERTEKMSRTDRIRAVKTKPIASMVLEHVWKRESDWLMLTLDDAEASRWLCHFAVLEGLDDLIVDWMKVELSKSAAVRFRCIEQTVIWRNTLFRSLIEAKLANAGDGQADDAIRLFFAVIEARRAKFPPEIYKKSNGKPMGPVDFGLPTWCSMSFWPAIVVMNIHLGKGGFPQTDARLYDHYVAYMVKSHSKAPEASRRLNIARLQLQHPEHPTADYAVSFLKQSFDGKSPEQIKKWLPPKNGLQRLFHTTFLIAARVAKQNGKQDDAIWLQQTYKIHEDLLRGPRRPLIRRQRSIDASSVQAKAHEGR